MKDLSVIIITRNRLEKLKRCLESVRTRLPNAEIIVIDNGSIDATRQFLANQAGVVVIRQNSNVGVAKARNIGAEKSRCQFLMFLDDDAWVEQLDVEAIWKHFETHPEVALIAPKLSYPDGSVQESVRTFPTMRALFWRGSGLYKVMPNMSYYRAYVDFDSTSVHTVDWAIGACQIIRRDVFEAVGGFDGRYFFGYEDADFCKRLSMRGNSVVYWPRATIYHEYARTSSKSLNRHLFHHLCSILRFFFTS